MVCKMAQDALPWARVVEHHSSYRAFQEIYASGVDLLITDCHMPDLDGPGLVRMIREQKFSVPIIMVSACEDARKLGEQAGIDRFVHKSRLSQELDPAIKSLLAG